MHGKTIELAAIKPGQSFLGRYHTAEKTISGKPVMVSRRDNWSTGELFQDRLGLRTYEVQPSGALKRV